MLYDAKNGSLILGERAMDYISFGKGDRTLILIPGVGDGLKTVKGMALPFALMYRAFAKRYRVYGFSRVTQLAEGATTRDMARDLKLAMDELGIASASVIGVSQGGMIAQYLALDFPERVEKLVLAVTLSRPNSTVKGAIEPWVAMAEKGDYRGIMRDSTEKSYSEAYLRAHRWLLPLIGLVGGPKDFTRFKIQARACLCHDAYDRLTEIKCPTLILGGGEDKIVGAEASREMAERMADSELYMYDGLGHAAYEEAGDFNARVLAFLDKP